MVPKMADECLFLPKDSSGIVEISRYLEEEMTSFKSLLVWR